MRSKPRIAITMGDPAGIGPEVCLQLLKLAELWQYCTPLIFGDHAVLQQVAQQCDLPMCETVYSINDWSQKVDQLSGPTLFDFGLLQAAVVTAGQVAANCGMASFRYLEKAIELALNNQVAAIVTGPINKESLAAALIPFPGHTEILADKTNSPNYCMMQASEELNCTFATTHVGYAEVPKLLTTKRIFEVIKLSQQAMQKIYQLEPTIIVCGLNPHAGEAGLFGDREEETIILPAIKQAQEQGIQVIGPLPPDTAFLTDRRGKQFCTVCMYHDQGHIPLKALAFDKAVNTTLGLPIIRTSVDHGTAFDIARTGKASASSLIQAVKLAIKLTARTSKVH